MYHTARRYHVSYCAAQISKLFTMLESSKQGQRANTFNATSNATSNAAGLLRYSTVHTFFLPFLPHSHIPSSCSNSMNNFSSMCDRNPKLRTPLWISK